MGYFDFLMLFNKQFSTIFSTKGFRTIIYVENSIIIIIIIIVIFKMSYSLIWNNFEW